MEKKFIVAILLGLILIGVMVWVFIKHVFGPEVSFLYPEKEKFVRYYACSLALCARGCDYSNLTQICLEKDKKTGTCKLTCKDLCSNPPKDWPKNETKKWNTPGALCGKNFPLELDLNGRVPLKGCTSPPWRLWTTEILQIFPEIEEILGIEITPGAEIDVPGTLVGEIYDENRVSCVEKVFDHNYLGRGQIYLDPVEAREKFGCIIKDSYNLCLDYSCSQESFTQCLFQGNLRIWSLWAFSTRADVRITLSAVPPADFSISATPSYKTAEVNHLANYTINITNELGTNSNFQLSYYASANTVSCKFYVDSQESSSLIVRDGETAKAKLSCKASSAGQYYIRIEADPTVAVSPKSVFVHLKAMDFSLKIVHPANKKQTIEKNGEGKFKINITNELGTNHDFTLHYSSDATCSFSSNPLHVENNSKNQTWMICTSDTEGEYQIHVWSTAEGITREDYATLKVLKCVGDIRLEVPSSVKSGEEFTLRAYNLSGCEERRVNIAVHDPNFRVKYCDNWNEDGSNCTLTFTANTPGTYTVYAEIDKNEDGDYKDEGEMTSATLTINEPSMDGRSCDMCNGEWCSYHHDKFCQHYVSWPNNWEACKNSCDPQICKQDNVGWCANYSNICCISGDENHYSSGPGVPCLSPDNDKTSGGGHKNNYIVWRGGNLNNARNILVGDDPGYPRQGYYARFTQDYCGGNDGLCNGSSELSGFTGLRGAKCVLTDVGSICGYEIGSKWLCELSPSLPKYSSWLYIKIAEDKRPVYGIRIRGYVDTGCSEWYEAPPAPWCEWFKFGVFLHNNSGWFEAGSGFIWTTDGQGRRTVDFRPPGEWAWKNIDALLIVNEGAYLEVCSLFDGCYMRDCEFQIDYIGLLTKGANIPYCTAGNANDYYRTVDDGKTCYWNVSCSTSGTGWTGKESTGVGPFGECSCSSGSCGEGYCEESINSTHSLCYYNVTCKNGGWTQAGIKICDKNNGEVCGVNGGTC